MGGVRDMADSDRSIPEFASDDEERAFWETHDIRDYDDGPADIASDIKREKKKRVTMRLEPSLIDELKELADDVEVPYQTLTRACPQRGGAGQAGARGARDRRFERRLSGIAPVGPDRGAVARRFKKGPSDTIGRGPVQEAG
jgi:predicted DNA binding CopG/RHH family protein